MNKDNNKMKWLLGVGTCLYFFVKFVGPLIVKAMVGAQSVAGMNALCGVTGVQPLNYYVGMMENMILGPLHMLLAGLVFLGINFLYLKEGSLKKYFLAIFIFLIATKFEILFWPPYGDSASGPCVEAIWLVRNHFNYALLAQQKSFIAGGPKVYLFSIYPTFLAVLIKFIPNTKVFLFVNHMITFALGAGIIALFRGMVEKLFSKDCGLLASLLLLFIPLYQAQVEQINMAIPVLFFAVLSSYYLVEKKFWMAALMAIVAAMVKGVAIIICGSVFVVCCGVCLCDPDLKRKWNVFLAGCVAMAFVVFKYFAAFYVLNKDGKASMVGLLMGWEKMRTAGTFYVFIIISIFLICYLAWSFIKKGVSFRELVVRDYPFLVMFVYTCSWFALFIHSQGLQPRYWLLMMPFQLFCIIFMMSVVVRSEILRKSILTTAIIFALLCSYGLFYEPVLMNAHSAQERTLEYRNDLFVHLEMVKILEERFSHFTVGAPFTFGHTLALRELGYVSKDLDVLMYQFPCTYGIRTFKGLAELDLFKTIWVGVKTETSLPKAFPGGFDYPIGKEDQIVETIKYGNREINLFVGGVSIEKMRMLRYMMLKQMIKKGLVK